jgi:hypothetical protein
VLIEEDGEAVLGFSSDEYSEEEYLVWTGIAAVWEIEIPLLP